MSYPLRCACGRVVTVELFQAGAEVQCPGCRNLLTVPSSIDLQKQAQEYSPFLSASDKVRKAVAEKLPPFDGLCQTCRTRPFDHEWTANFRFLTERTVLDEDGPQLSPLGLRLTVGATEEFWEMLEFPLLYCEPCNDSFEREWSAAAWKRRCGLIVMGIVTVPLTLIVVLLLMAMPLIGGGALMLIAVMIRNYFRRRRIDPYLQKILSKLPLVSEAIAQEDEYKLTLSRRVAP